MDNVNTKKFALYLILKISLILFFCSTETISQAQKDTLFDEQKDTVSIYKKNAVFVELLGNGTLYSLNYERLIHILPYLSFSARVGASMDHVGSYYFPVLVNVIAGHNGHYGEFGLGTTIDLTHYELNNKWETTYLKTFNIGYRYQKPGGKWLFRIDITPVVSKDYKMYDLNYEKSIKTNPTVRLTPWFGISAGLRF